MKDAEEDNAAPSVHHYCMPLYKGRKTSFVSIVRLTEEFSILYLMMQELMEQK